MTQVNHLAYMYVYSWPYVEIHQKFGYKENIVTFRELSLEKQTINSKRHNLLSWQLFIWKATWYFYGSVTDLLKIHSAV